MIFGAGPGQSPKLNTGGWQDLVAWAVIFSCYMHYWEDGMKSGSGLEFRHMMWDVGTQWPLALCIKFVLLKFLYTLRMSRFFFKPFEKESESWIMWRNISGTVSACVCTMCSKWWFMLRVSLSLPEVMVRTLKYADFPMKSGTQLVCVLTTQLMSLCSTGL